MLLHSLFQCTGNLGSLGHRTRAPTRAALAPFPTPESSLFIPLGGCCPGLGFVPSEKEPVRGKLPWEVCARPARRPTALWLFSDPDLDPGQNAFQGGRLGGWEEARLRVGVGQVLSVLLKLGVHMGGWFLPPLPFPSPCLPN